MSQFSKISSTIWRSLKKRVTIEEMPWCKAPNPVPQSARDPPFSMFVAEQSGLTCVRLCGQPAQLLAGVVQEIPILLNDPPVDTDTDNVE